MQKFWMRVRGRESGGKRRVRKKEGEKEGESKRWSVFPPQKMLMKKDFSKNFIFMKNRITRETNSQKTEVLLLLLLSLSLYSLPLSLSGTRERERERKNVREEENEKVDDTFQEEYISMECFFFHRKRLQSFPPFNFFPFFFHSFSLFPLFLSEKLSHSFIQQKRVRRGFSLLPSFVPQETWIRITSLFFFFETNRNRRSSDTKLLIL